MSKEIVHRVQAAWKKDTLIDNETYLKWYGDSVKDPEKFWGRKASGSTGSSPTRRSGTPPSRGNVSIKWFEDGKLNVSYNCLDRHLTTRGDQVAIIWEGDDPDEDSKITYRELHGEVCQFANVLKSRRQEGRPGPHLHADDPGRRPSRCWPARASARSTPSCSAASRRDALAERIVDCQSAVLITADEACAAGARCRSRPTPTRRPRSPPGRQ